MSIGKQINFNSDATETKSWSDNFEISKLGHPFDIYVLEMTDYYRDFNYHITPEQLEELIDLLTSFKRNIKSINNKRG